MTSQKPLKVIANLLKQLIHSPPSRIPDKLKTKFQVAPNSRLQILDIIEMFKECSKQFSTVAVLLDAFDECAAVEQKAIVDLLNELGREGIRVFVTSRPERRHYLESKLINSISEEIRAHDEDVVMYLSERLKENDEIDSKLKDDIIEELRKKAVGM